MSSNVDKFHEHLDVCKQCENNPFDLCETGNNLIRKAATEAVELTSAQLAIGKDRPQ